MANSRSHLSISDMDSCSKWTLNVLYLVITAIAFIGFTYNLSYYFNFNHYFETQCLIKNITYPSTLNAVDGDLWQRCRCGDNCYIERPCIRLYTTQLDSDEIFEDYIKYDVQDKNRHCTFYEHKCKDGDEPGKREEYLAQSLEIVENYRNKIVTCYRTNNNQSAIFLEFDIDNSYILIIVFGSILAFLGVIAVIHRFCKIVERCRELHNLSRQ